MKSMYTRQLVTMLCLIALCIVMMGTGFLALSYRYNQKELQDTIQRDLTYISRYASTALSGSHTLTSEDFHSYITSVSMITNASVLLCRNDGGIVYATGDNFTEHTPAHAPVPSWVVNQILANGSYTGRTTFNHIFASDCFVTGVPIITYYQDPITRSTISDNEPIGLLFIATDATSLSEFMNNTSQMFIATAFVVLLITIIISSITVQKMVDPLKVMSDAARKFARGEITTRVTQYETRKDEIGELAEAFNAMADSLSQAEQKRSEFVSNVSHELKTPMTTIAGFAEGILDGTIPPEKERESLQVISSETRRLSRLVRRMLELSRLQSSERVAAQEQFDAAEVLVRVLVSLEVKITEKNLDVDANLPDGPVMVWGDPDAVTQVCYNLLDNAVKFSSPGGRLSLRMASKKGKVYTSIGNEGETIPPDQLSTIFDRFHKADGSRASHKEGVGLGLYIVKTILNTYKEDITVTSENGYTEFTFTLSEV